MLALAMIGLLRRLMPMRVWSKLMGTPRSPASGKGVSDQNDTNSPEPPPFSRHELEVSRGVTRASRLARGRFSCLDQACAGYLMLRRRGVSGILNIGILRNAATPYGEPLAHAWLETASGRLIGGSFHQDYVPVTVFMARRDDTEKTAQEGP